MRRFTASLSNDVLGRNCRTLRTKALQDFFSYSLLKQHTLFKASDTHTREREKPEFLWLHRFNSGPRNEQRGVLETKRKKD
jgi:hypothetical protein